ncbi:DNA damage-regulated autophagy modulator protein 1, partial [Stegodyphus mimosarum]
MTKVTEWSLNQGGYLAIAFGGFMVLGCITAYVIAVARGNVDPFLPLISDAAGSPPQNGLFGTLICIGGMFGVAFMILRYMIVLEQNREKSNVVTIVNKLSLFAGITSMLGITLVTGYPVNFYRNRDVWLMDVGLPHMIGGVMLFAMGLLYIALQCVLTLFLKTNNQMTLFVRVLLLFICTAAFVYHMITVPDNFGGISHLYYVNSTENELNYTGLMAYPPTMGASLKLPIDTSGSYVSSAITEWILVFFFCCFFFTFFSEAQEYSLLIVIETHSNPEAEPTEDQKPDLRKLSLAQIQNNPELRRLSLAQLQNNPELRKMSLAQIQNNPEFRKMSLAQIQNGSQIDAKPPPEVRKFLRRDSTCQTMTDTVDNVIIPTKFKNGTKKSDNKDAKTPKTDIANGTNKLVDSDVDAKLKRLLNENDDIEEQNGKESVEACTEHDVSISCDGSTTTKDEKINKKKTEKEDEDREAEQNAIEKIDVVVKEAEDHANNVETLATQNETGSLKKSDSDEALTSVSPLSLQ